MEETNDDQMWTVSRACGQLLQHVTLIVGDDVWYKMSQTVLTKLNGSTWLNTYVGLTLLGAMISGAS